jgi:virginiamycin B lyase
MAKAWMAALGAAALMTFACSSGSDEPNASHTLDATPTPTASASAEHFPVYPASDLSIVATINVGHSDWMGVGYDSLWVPTGGQLLRISPTTHAVLKRIPIGQAPYRGVGIGEGGIWIPNVGDNTLSKIDPATDTVVGSYPVSLGGDSEGSVGVGEGAVWLVTDAEGTQAGTLSRIDPNDGHVVANVPVAADSHGVVVAGGFVWVTSAEGNCVTKVDPGTNTVAGTIPVGDSPRFIAAGEGAVWVLSQGTGKVSRIDPAEGRVVSVIDAEAAGGGGDIAVGEGFLWVTTFARPVTKIDPRNDTVVAAYEGGSFGDAIRAGLGAVWVSGSHIWQMRP